jgi:6-phosphogluconolactonase
VTDPQVLRHDSPEALADAVVERLVETLVAAQREDRVPSVALTGGTVAAKIHERLLAASRETVDWSRVDVWWGDERFVPTDDPDRNARQAQQVLLDRLPVDPARVHPMPASDDGRGGLVDAAASYGRELREQGGGEFDVLMLGVGPDGHVASLFPGYPQLDVEDAIAVAVTDSPKPPPDRISLTFPALNHSREVWFVVSGDGKADAVARALAPETPDVHEIPAVGVHGREATLWFLDTGSASQLPAAT